MRKGARANVVDVQAGARLRARRRHSGLSQTKLAEQIGVTFQQVQKYEKGKNRMGSSRLQQLAHILEVPVSYFFDGIAAPSSPSKAISASADLDYVTKFTASDDGHALARAFTRITDARVRRRITLLVEAVAGEDD